ncbi:MAG: histidine phosphatase family protein [Acidimicrobiia bacterium]|nr:histidine phosphatase family protein [Acidimicrobiia bacterium]
MTTTRLLLVRHGESNATVQGILAGELHCTGLSDLGRRQAAALARRFDADGVHAVDALWSSQLPRARETAEILATALGGLEPNIDADLEEQRPGDADGTRFADFADRFGRVDHRRAPFTPMAPGAESFAGFHHRVGEAIYRVIGANEGESILVSCHGGVIDVVFRLLLGLPRIGSFDLWTLNTSVTEFTREIGDDGPGRWRLVRYNDHAHLAGLPAQTEA